MIEEWRAVPGFEGLYEVSNQGNVRALPLTYFAMDRWGNNREWRKPLRAVKAYVNKERGFYRYVNLRKDGQQHMRRIARLVAAAFHGPCPDGWQACHLDGSRNNDAAVNLKWGSPAENSGHREAHGTNPKGERHPACRLNEAIVRRMKYGSEDPEFLGQVFGVHPKHVSNIRRGVRWAHV